MATRNDLCNCAAARRAARALTRSYERHLAPAGLTSSQFSILVVIEDLPGLGMRELADELVMDRTSLVRALQPLQRDGLVAVAVSPHDARQKVYVLTPAGHAKAAEASPLWQEAQREFTRRFGGEAAATEAREAFEKMSRFE
ncbi:MarR family winged helix-turn-helix transcriptional regulator [Bacillus sp. NP157]|nr:MarR family winged helix-turn-helix transcriptional regulator [Bacillus sp. NP157]